MTDAHCGQQPITSLLSKCVGDWSLSIYYSVYAEIAKHVVSLSPCLPAINHVTSKKTKKITEIGNWPLKMKYSQEMKSDNARSEIRIESK